MAETLTELERAALIDQGLASPFWQQVIRPMLEERKAAMDRALRDPSLARKHKLPSDYIRGVLSLAEELLEHPAMLSESIRNSAIEEDMAEKREIRDSLIAHFGRGWSSEEL